MLDDKTMMFQLVNTDAAKAKEVLKEVYQSLKERGYNPVNQLVGYLISGDLGYISSYQDARRKIQAFDRSKLLEVLLTSFIGEK